MKTTLIATAFALTTSMFAAQNPPAATPKQPAPATASSSTATVNTKKPVKTSKHVKSHSKKPAATSTTVKPAASVKTVTPAPVKK